MRPPKPQRLPTVALKNSRTGKTTVINQTDYARDVGRWAAAGWKIMGMSHGNVPDAEVEWHKEQAEIEVHRRTDPAEMKKRGDAERAFKQRAIKQNVVTEEPAPKAEQLDDAWQKLPWFKRRAYVREKTGVQPQNVVEAERLMAQLEAALGASE